MKNRIKRNVWSIVSVCAFIYVCVNPAVYGAGSPPVAVADSYTNGKEDTPYPCTTVLANDFDPDGEPLSAKLKVNVRHGTLAFEEEDGTFVYTPDPDFNGSDYFSYSAWDGELESSPVKVTIVIKDNSSPQYEDVPIPQDQNVTTPMNTSVEITLFAKGSLMQEVVTDDDCEDDDVAEYQLTGGTPANGTVSWVDFDTLIYTPDDNYVGSDTITFRAKDSDDNWSDDTGVDNDTSGGYADGTVSITVTSDIVIGD